MSIVHVEKEAKIATLTIHRPEALNALNTACLAELEATIDALKMDSDLRCVIVRGGGEKAFVAGADIAEMAEKTSEEGEAFSTLGNRVMAALAVLPCPVIAEIQGYALGGGFELSLACDLRIASEKAVFAFPETGLGITPGFGGTQRLARLVGPALAAELIYTGRRVKAEEAERSGLVNRVVPGETLHTAVMEIAAKIAANAPIAIRQAKASLMGGLDLPLAEGLALEARNFGQCFASQDQRAAMAAFLSKSGPVSFKNR